MSVKVFYNKSCNVCNYEINHYKKLSINNDIIWIDIVQNEEALKLTSKTYKQLLRRIHIINNGKLIEGAAAFLEIWKNIPKYKILYHIFKFKIFYFFLFIFYEISAYLLFVKNKHLLNKNEKSSTRI